MLAFPLNSQPDKVVVPYVLRDLGNNNWTANWPMGADTVMSVQPNGDIQTRPNGTAGAYEVFKIVKHGFLFSPAGTPYLFPAIIVE